MPAISIILDGDGAFPDLRNAGERIVHVTTPFSVSRLRHGMASGLSSVMIRIDLPDGHIVLAETSMALFQQAASAFKIRDEMEAQGQDQQNARQSPTL